MGKTNFCRFHSSNNLHETFTSSRHFSISYMMIKFLKIPSARYLAKDTSESENRTFETIQRKQRRCETHSCLSPSLAFP